MPNESLSIECCIVGGGPAGMMLGFLLARSGVDVVVLEKHADFLRDFRGDTIHPSTLEVLGELGILDDFLKRPHQKVTHLDAQFDNASLTVADFSHLPVRCPFIAFMPQWDFLDFIAGEGRRYPSFRLITRAEVVDVIEEVGQVVGVRARTPDGPLEVHASLVVGADGRTSIVRDKAGLVVENIGAPMDVLWFGLSRAAADSDDVMARFGAGNIFIMINRGDYWQCGFVIPKGSADLVRAKGLDAFRKRIAELSPFIIDRVGELDSWDKIKLLTVGVDRLKRWYKPGLLCIGDASHTMSPVGGVGINLAIQDAVAAANILARPLRENCLRENDLATVQKRREWPARMTQAFQVFVQKRVITSTLAGTGTIRPPLLAKLLHRFPILRRIPARLIGMGLRPEHVRTAEVPQPR
jgi:2-polyprenyl-6-methoxyphenol hydroxylase-like FAD-dependent oxidoreductase